MIIETAEVEKLLELTNCGMVVNTLEKWELWYNWWNNGKDNCRKQARSKL